MLVNSWRLLPGGEIKTQGCDTARHTAHTENKQDSVGEQETKQTRAGGLFSVAQDRQVESIWLRRRGQMEMA